MFLENGALIRSFGFSIDLVYNYHSIHVYQVKFANHKYELITSSLLDYTLFKRLIDWKYGFKALNKINIFNYI